MLSWAHILAVFTAARHCLANTSLSAIPWILSLLGSLHIPLWGQLIWIWDRSLKSIPVQQYFLQTPLESLCSCPGIKNHTITFPSVVILPLYPSPSNIFFFPSLNCLFLSLFSESPVVFSFNYHTKKKNLPASLRFYYQILSHAGFYAETIE